MIAFFNEVGVVHTEVMNALKRAYGQAPATAVLCALTILIYLLTVVESRSIEHNLSDSWIADHWTLYGPYSHGLGWLRMVGTVFLHSGPTHLALNMFMLFFFGREIEHYLGSGRFTLAYNRERDWGLGNCSADGSACAYGGCFWCCVWAYGDFCGDVVPVA
ncbi:hypothetical protein FRC0182_02258 [Corynebacterium diphtheriae]|nr:hypothetical protein FRC0182_02258 [Corynebacterium diphtheriae]